MGRTRKDGSGSSNPVSTKVAKGTTSRRGSREDSNLGFRGNKFVSPAAEVEYRRLLECTVSRERGFVPGEYMELTRMITERGWQTICEPPPAVPLSIVREFYANAKEEKNGMVVVRGVTVDYSAQAIRAVLNQPEEPPFADDWGLKTRASPSVDLDAIVRELCVPGTVWKCKPGTTEQVTFPAAAMNRYARAWNMFIAATVFPTSHYHDVTVERAIVLYGILDGEYVDVGDLIHRNMMRFLGGGTTRAIPHASVVIKLCTAAGVSWGSEEQLQRPVAPIDHRTIEKLAEWSGGIPHPRGLGYTVAADQGGSSHQGGASQQRVSSQDTDQHTGASSGLSDTQFRRLIRRLDAQHDINRRYAQDLNESLGVFSAAQGVEITWPVFGEHTPYPPPDTPPATPPEEGDE